jgi:hypothetical protein
MLDTAAQRAANLAKGMLASSAKPGVPGKK